MPGTVVCPGILVYTHADGTTTRELYPEDEARSDESLRSLRDVPVTLGHPAQGTRQVTPDSYRSDAVGHVSESSYANGVVATLVILDKGAIDKVDRADVSELSAGYSVDIDPTPGVWRGQRYDAIQRNRRYNHVALLPEGQARAGREARLRIDGVDDYAWQSCDAGRVVKMDRIDGIEYEIGTDAWKQARARYDAARDKRVSDLEAERDREAARADREAARADAAESRVAPEALSALVHSRATLLSDARRVLGDVRCDGMSDREIREAVLEKLLSKKFDSHSDEYVTARYDGAMESLPSQSAESRKALVRETRVVNKTDVSLVHALSRKGNK